LLGSESEITGQIETLEVHSLASGEGDLRFALLSDWSDAAAESLPEDEELFTAAANGIAALNARHGPAPGGGDRFFLLHRRRLWNEKESRWIGWERKRGKCPVVKSLLRGAGGPAVLSIPPGT